MDGESHVFTGDLIGIILLVPETDFSMICVYDSVVAYCDSMSIPADIFYNTGRIIKWRLAIHHPIGFEQVLNKMIKFLFAFKLLMAVWYRQIAVIVCGLKSFNELSSKDF